MSSRAQLQRVRAEWQANRRLRIGVLVIVGIVALQALLAVSDSRAARVEQYERDARLLSRLEEASGESSWPERAKAAEAALAKLRGSIPVASSEGLAQAELQAWLGDLAVFAGVGNPTVRVESALAVEDQPGMWQVLGRLDGSLAESQVPVLARTLQAALPWYRTERLEVEAGTNARVSLVIRGYFRKGEGTESAAVRPADLPAAQETRTTGAPAVPVQRNPLAPVQPAPARRDRSGEARPLPRNPLAPPAADTRSPRRAFGRGEAGHGDRNEPPRRPRRND